MSDAITITRRSDGKYVVQGIGPEPELYDGASTLARTIEMAVQTLQPPSLIERLRAMGIRPEYEKDAMTELTARRNISLRDEVLAVLPAEHPEWFNPNSKPPGARLLISELASEAGAHTAPVAPPEPSTFTIEPPPAASEPGATAPEPEPLPWRERLNALTVQKNPQGAFVLTGPNTYKVIPVEAALHGDTLAHDLLAVVAQLQSEPDDDLFEFTSIPERLENQAGKIKDLLESLKNYTGVHISRDLDDRIIKVRLEDTAPSLRLVTDNRDETLSTAADDIEAVRRHMREELDLAAEKLLEQKRLTAREESRRKLYGGLFERIRYVVIGEGPEEFFRLTEAMKKADRNVAETWIHYLTSLWKERDGLRAELNRFKEGKLTPEEMQNLCHNLSPLEVTLQNFCDGCEQYQIKLFGRSPITELRERIAAADMLLVQVKNAAGNLEGIIQNRERDAFTDAMLYWAGDIKTLCKVYFRKGNAAEETEKRLEGLQRESRERGLLLERAWGLIANAGGGNWMTQPGDWQQAAANWRDEFHFKLPLL